MKCPSGLLLLAEPGICSASEPYSYNGLRNRIFGNVSPVFLGLWRAPPAGAVSAPCTPARCQYFIIKLCLSCVLKGLRTPVSTRRFFVFVGAVPIKGGSALSCYITTDVVFVKWLLSEPGICGDFKDWKDLGAG